MMKNQIISVGRNRLSNSGSTVTQQIKKCIKCCILAAATYLNFFLHVIYFHIFYPSLFSNCTNCSNCFQSHVGPSQLKLINLVLLALFGLIDQLYNYLINFFLFVQISKKIGFHHWADEQMQCLWNFCYKCFYTFLMQKFNYCHKFHFMSNKSSHILAS